MSVAISVYGYSSKENKQYLKHFNAVKYCMENELSYPKETSDFFKGKVAGDDLEDFENDYILEHIENGLEIELKTTRTEYETRIKVSDIPKDCVELLIKLS